MAIRYYPTFKMRLQSLRNVSDGITMHADFRDEAMVSPDDVDKIMAAPDVTSKVMGLPDVCGEMIGLCGLLGIGSKVWFLVLRLN